MPSMLRTLSLALGLAALSTAASAQTMEFGCPKPGTTFTLDSGANLVARGQDGMDCVMQNVGGPTFKVRALLFDNPGPDGKDTSAFIAAIKPERLWPLEVGKKIEATYSAGGKTWEMRYPDRRSLREVPGPGGALLETLHHRDE